MLINCLEPAWLELANEVDWRRLLEPCAVETFRQTKWGHYAVISCLLTNDEEVQQLNKVYRGKNSPTNVLSFPLIEFAEPALPKEPCFEYNQLGDVVLSFETVQRESLNLGLSVQDHSVHLFVHSVLHLLGYDHEEEGEARVMEGLETSVLEALGRADPYAQEKGGDEPSDKSDHFGVEPTSL